VSSGSRASRRSRSRIPTPTDSRSQDPVPAAATASWWWRGLGPLAIALITVAVFWPALGHQFVDWDDPMNLVDNLEFRGLGWQNLRWMFTTTLAGHWIPVTWISFGVDYRLWGMNPLGYHLTNVLLHAASAVVFYFVALRLLRVATGAGERVLRLGALAAALFFAIHPLRVESVAWATERRDVLSGLWFLLTILTYLKAVGSDGARRRGWLAGSVACFGLAAMSKAIVMTLPVVLIVLDVYPLRRLPARWREWTARAARSVWGEKAPYVAVSIVTGVVAQHAIRSYGDMIAALPLENRVAVALYGLAFYVWKTFIPILIAPMYQLLADQGPYDGPMLASAAGVIGLTAVLVWLRRQWPAGLAVWISYVVLVAPVSGIIQSGPQLVAARYSYLPGLGLALLVGGAVGRLGRWAVERPRSRRWALAGLAVVVVGYAGLAVLSWRLVWVWRDSETLWVYAVSLEPTSPLAHGNLGFAYLNRGRLPEAERETRVALRLAPEWELGQQNLAAVLAWQERFVEAGEARAQLGYLLLKHRKYDVAVTLFQKEVSVRLGDAAAHNNLGAALLLRGDVGPAIEHFEESLRLDPGHDKARRNLAAARQCG
jgi:tetratricopeptide (TPR) repeat protein